MSSKVNRLSQLFMFILSFVFIVNQVSAQTVNVKMRINTSTCLDTLTSKHIVYLCGETSNTGGTTPAITWDPKTTALKATNVGGDYWEVSFKANAGDVIKYKFLAFFNATTPTFHWTGWEGPIDAGFNTGDNRGLVVGKKDTTLALQYFNGWESKVAQYWRPFAVKKDTIAVYFRVNVGGVAFDATKQTVEARGGIPLGTDSPWITIASLKRETNSVGGGTFWSGVAYIAKSKLTAAATQSFKFVLTNPETWESTTNRSFPISLNTINVTGDTTLTWVYFNNKRPTGPQVTGNVNFRLKLDALEKAKLFDRGLGDKVVVTGAKGWLPGTPGLQMTYVPSIQEWVLSEPFTLFPQTDIVYKYFISFDTSKVNPTNKNYIPGLTLDNGWEEPGATGGADRKYVFTNAKDQTVPGDFGADQQFFNGLHPNGVLTTPIKLGFKVDMAPATNVTTNATNPLFRPGIDTVWVQFDGCFIPITQGKSMYGTDNRIQLTDSDGDGKYTGTIDLKAPTFYQVCYRISYSSTSGTITNGGGVLKGRRYYQYILPTKISPSITWPSTYELAMVTWKASDLTVENPPDLGKMTDVADEQTVPTAYELQQNYPNPFNPSTVISYSIPRNEKVKLEVFDMLGRKVATLFSGEQFAGTHSVSWNSNNDFGVSVASGVYLFRIQAGSFTQVKKMMLVR